MFIWFVMSKYKYKHPNRTNSRAHPMAYTQNGSGNELYILL